MAAMNPAASEPGVLHFNVNYPERVSRLLIFVKTLLALPQLIILNILMRIIVFVAIPIGFVAILFIGRFPLGLWNFALGIFRWQANVDAYILLQRDEYPPFSFERNSYPILFDMEYPPRQSRLLIFVKWFLVIPSAFAWFVLRFISWFVLVIAWFAILFTGRFPRGMFDFITGVSRWGYRLKLYFFLMTDKYPPFSLD